MLETFNTVSSSYFLHAYNDDLCCPIPRRPSSPAFVSWVAKKRRRSQNFDEVTEELGDNEACQELQEILLGQLPLVYSAILSESGPDFSEESDSEISQDTSSNSVRSVSDCGVFPSINLSKYKKVIPAKHSPKLPFNPTVSPVKTVRITKNFVSNDTFDSLLQFPLEVDSRDKFTASVGVFQKIVRPKLGSSTSNLSALVISSERETVITPPARAHNPLPMNVAFSNRKATEGPEFGLLSVSPPRADDEETLRRRQRVKRFVPPLSQAVPSKPHSSKRGKHESRSSPLCMALSAPVPLRCSHGGKPIEPLLPTNYKLSNEERPIEPLLPTNYKFSNEEFSSGTLLDNVVT